MRQNKHRLLKKVILFLVENKELKTWKSILKIKHSKILPKYWNAEMVTRLRLGEDDCRAKRVGYGHEIIFCGCNGTGAQYRTSLLIQIYFWVIVPASLVTNMCKGIVIGQAFPAFETNTVMI